MEKVSFTLDRAQDEVEKAREVFIDKFGGPITQVLEKSSLTSAGSACIVQALLGEKGIRNTTIMGISRPDRRFEYIVALKTGQDVAAAVRCNGKGIVGETLDQIWRENGNASIFQMEQVEIKEIGRSEEGYATTLATARACINQTET